MESEDLSSQINLFVNWKIDKLIGNVYAEWFFWWVKPINIRQLMDEEKIILVKLNQNLIWPQTWSLIWLIVVQSVMKAAMSRATIWITERKKNVLYIDEFQNFVTEDLKTILAEARKYWLWLVLANQFLAQIWPDKLPWMKEAIFGNAWTVISFTVSPEDAEQIATLMEPFKSEDLKNMPKYTTAARLMIENDIKDAFSMKTIMFEKTYGWRIDEKLMNIEDIKKLTELKNEMIEYSLSNYGGKYEDIIAIADNKHKY